MEGWRKLRVWLEENEPEIASSFQPPKDSNGECFRKLENLPGSEQAIDYLTVSDGQESWPLRCLFPGYIFLNCEDVLGEMENDGLLIEFTIEMDSAPESFQSHPPNYIRDVFKNHNWIPIASNIAGSSIHIDNDPDFAGSRGQIILWDPDAPGRFVLAENLNALFSHLHLLIISGALIAEKDSRGEFSMNWSIPKADTFLYDPEEIYRIHYVKQGENLGEVHQ